MRHDVRYAGPAERRPGPVVPEPHDLRASDAERERTVEALRAHSAEGRLSADELEERLGRALAAATRADLVAVLADLPPRAAAPAAFAPRPRHRKDPRAMLAIAALLVAIWALTGAGYFWPMWPLAWFAFASMAHLRRSNTQVIGNRINTQ